jgi:hypothetical protein
LRLSGWASFRRGCQNLSGLFRMRDLFRKPIRRFSSGLFRRPTPQSEHAR